ncbi:glyoxalase/bleomycin resistance/extradiol dioxygenase family protein [Rhodococcus sp. 15-1154-1]|nr:glyoxalase/bleomycin resistance/extradiol dioxygenase family protein [Rhodococcus sp. 15-1154-1]
MHVKWKKRPGDAGIALGPSIPILRMFDDAATRAFYIDYLGYDVEWEHRFEPGMPLYMRVRRSGSVLDLSEHHGDGTPGTVVWIPVQDIRAFHRQLDAAEYRSMRPGLDTDAPGGPTVTVIDPSSNVLRFCQVEDPDEYTNR